MFGKTFPNFQFMQDMLPQMRHEAFLLARERGYPPPIGSLSWLSSSTLPIRPYDTMERSAELGTGELDRRYFRAL